MIMALYIERFLGREIRGEGFGRGPVPSQGIGSFSKFELQMVSSCGTFSKFLQISRAGNYAIGRIFFCTPRIPDDRLLIT